MKQIHTYLLLLALCSCASSKPKSCEQQETLTSSYLEQFDKASDAGQYWHPEINVLPQALITIDGIANGYDNNGIGYTAPDRGLQSHLFAQSVAGVVNKALNNGKSQYGVWLDSSNNFDSYDRSITYLKSAGVDTNFKSLTIDEILDCEYIRPFIKGYILTDVEQNPESAVYAATAAHIYDAVIIDSRDESYYKQLTQGEEFTMLCDATQKSTADAWHDFKDSCKNSALVIMPVQTGQLREFAITNNLFVINLNHTQGSSVDGQNTDLLNEVLAWLEPNSPVYGWESGVGEDVFVGKVSQYGHMMIPCDWVYNMSLMSINYKERQGAALANVVEPASIDYDTKYNKYVSFYLSDGDNIQWMINNFISQDYYTHPLSSQLKMSYGVAASNLSMVNADQFSYLIARQMDNCSVVETFGGGYYYADTFGELGNRNESLTSISKSVAAHMRQQRIKVLALITKDVDSQSAKEAYQRYISENDQLEGVIAMQYSPYAGGEGEIMWFENSQGIDIPVITVKYTLWDFGSTNHEREGTPTYIANKILEEDNSSPFSLVGVHAWSSFADQGESSSETLEATAGNKTETGAGAAKLCVDKLNNQVKVVNIEEMIWRIRMTHRENQTKKILNL